MNMNLSQMGEIKMPDESKKLTAVKGGHVGGSFDWRTDPKNRKYDQRFLDDIHEAGLKVEWKSDGTSKVVERKGDE